MVLVPYQNVVRIRNKFFQILDPDPYHGSATLGPSFFLCLILVTVYLGQCGIRISSLDPDPSNDMDPDPTKTIKNMKITLIFLP